MVVRRPSHSANMADFLPHLVAKPKLQTMRSGVKATFLSYAPAVLQRYPISAGNDIRFLAGEVFGASYFYSPARTVARTASSKVAKTWMFHFTVFAPLSAF